MFKKYSKLSNNELGEDEFVKKLNKKLKKNSKLFQLMQSDDADQSLIVKINE